MHKQRRLLFNILPGALRESLLCRATDPGPYTRVRDMVRSQATWSLLQQQRLPLHRVEESPPAQDEEQELNFETMTRDDLVAFVKSCGNGAGVGARALRKCPNCGLVHKELKCLHPAVDFKDRPCFKCGKKNHLAKDCKEKLAGVNEERRIGSLHAGAPLRSLSALNDGFSTPKKTTRQLSTSLSPRPTGSPACPNESARWPHRRAALMASREPWLSLLTWISRCPAATAAR